MRFPPVSTARRPSAHSALAASVAFEPAAVRHATRIASLEKDIQGLKKEIRERDETIGDKEKRIYDLKKKNQELEKFKFVLDYKIKELKRQIEPRENEIADMRKQVEEMDMELEQYHKSNSALDLMIGELRLKMDGMQKEINGQKTLIADGAFVSGTNVAPGTSVTSGGGSTTLTLSRAALSVAWWPSRARCSALYPTRKSARALSGPLRTADARQSLSA